MQTRRTYIAMGLILALVFAWLPARGLAQQRTDRSSATEDEDRTVFDSRRGRGQAARVEDDQGEDDTEGGGNVNVQIVAAADERTNSVVVRGPAELLDLVAEVLNSLDSTTAQIAHVRVYQLKYADAMNTADVINRLFGEEQTSRNEQRGPFPMMFRGPGGRDGRSDDEEGSQAKVVAAADSQTNTVVVAGPENMMEVVGQVVRQLDAPAPDVADVKVFHLEYADAQDTAELINEVFGESASSRSSRSRGQDSQQIRFMRGGFGWRSRTFGRCSVWILERDHEAPTGEHERDHFSHAIRIVHGRMGSAQQGCRPVSSKSVDAAALCGNCFPKRDVRQGKNRITGR